jgi:glycerol-3-phosphate dehydrogenase
MSKEYHADMAIVGGGIAGLMVGKKLVDLGFDVTLIEKGKTLADGQTTKNEGWLHRGTVHSVVTSDRQKAMQITERIIYGHDYIRSYAPEAIEEPLLPLFALIQNPMIVDEAMSRWNEAGVQYEPVTHQQFSSIVPQADSSRLAEIFKVDDVVINSRMLLQKLLSDMEYRGANILTQATLIPSADTKGEIHFSDGTYTTISANIFINTTGSGMKEFYRNFLGVELPMRFWKSHLLLFPRLTQSSIFHVDKYESTLHNHGKYSVCGQNSEVALVETADSSPIVEGAQSVFEAAVRMIPDAQYLLDSVGVVPCIKPDLNSNAGASRSVDVEISEPIPNYIFVLPGKMTESPYVADEVVRLVFDRASDSRITLRPCETDDLPNQGILYQHGSTNT